MSAPPKTVLTASLAEEESIRHAVRHAEISLLGPGRVIADASHVPALLPFLADPAVSGPIYDLPRPVNEATVSAWVATCEAERQRGEGLLVLTMFGGEVGGYSKFTLWPDRASGELGGAMAAQLQGQGAGMHGMIAGFDFLFDVLGVRLVGLTAALDNHRSARNIDKAGFTRMGEREAVRADGTIRRSIYWEMTRDNWHLLRRGAV